MRLNQASDFALRILMLVAEEEKPLTVEEVAKRLRLVKSHVMKIVAKLNNAGLLQTQRGRVGGVTLGRPPNEITIGEVVRKIEADFAIVECMKSGDCDCVFARGCKLQGVFSDATSAFLEVLDNQSLQSILYGKMPEPKHLTT